MESTTPEKQTVRVESSVRPLRTSFKAGFDWARLERTERGRFTIRCGQKELEFTREEVEELIKHLEALLIEPE